MTVKKNFPFLFVLSALFFIYGASDAIAIDAPHDYTNTIACTTCHPESGVLPLWLVGNVSADSVCNNCHDNPAIPLGDKYRLIKTHSNTTTSTTAVSKYRTWAIECRTCHSPHYQWQAVKYPADGYVDYGAGTIALDISNTVLTDPSKNWTPDAFKGYLLVPNIANPTAIYRIIGNTATKITVAGADFADEGFSMNYAVKYGKLIQDKITMPNTVINNVTVKFFNNTGANSFADSDAAIDGICQVCHTQTKSFKNSGALEASGLHPNAKAGTDCTTCHKHTEGFKVTGCDSCHGNPPTASPSTAIGGPNGLVAITIGGTGSTSPGAHQKHAVTLAYTCDTCHTGGMTESLPYDKTIQIGFSAFAGVRVGGAYIGQPLNGYTYIAGNAQTSVVSNPVTTTLQCSNIYCHGGLLASGGTDTTPVWNDPSTVACGTCHGVSSTTNYPTRGSHTKHTGPSSGNIGYAIGCQTCHNSTTTTGTTITNATNHVNNAADWGFDASDSRVSSAQYRSLASGSVANPPSSAYGSCSTVYCHSNGVGTYTGPMWGNAASGACGTCHGVNAITPPTSERHTKHVGSTAGYTYSCSKCHSSAVSETANATTVPAIASTSLHVNRTKDVAWDTFNPSGSPYNTGPTCANLYCHSRGTSSTTSTPNITPSWTGVFDTTCTGCHNGDSLAPNKMDTGTHTKHVATYNYDCTKCHNETVSNSRTISNPANHVNKLVNVKFDAATNLNSTATYNGTLSPVAKTPGTSFGVCSNTYCHSDGTSVATGNIPTNTSPTWGSTAVPLACTTCHGYPPSYDQMTSTTASPKANEHAYHMANGINLTCRGCHYETTTTDNTITNPARHVNGQYDVVVAPGMTYSGTPVNFTYRSDPGGLGGYCDNVTCHGGIPNAEFWGRIKPYISGITPSYGPGCFDMTLTIQDVNMINVAFPVTSTWNYGDGQTGSEMTSNAFPISSASHHYADGNLRTVTISGRDSLKRYFTKSQAFTPQAVGNRPPVAGWSPVTHNRYTATVTDLSYDPDYGTCETGTGQISIAWGDPGNGRTSDNVYLTTSPLNKNYTYVYGHSASDTTYTVSHSVVDNGGASATNSPQTSSVTVPGTTTISGRITRSDGTTPVAGVTVYLQSNYFWQTCASTTTNTNGSYSFSGTGGCYNDNALFVTPCVILGGACSFSPTYTDPPISINRSDVNFTAAP